MSEGRNIEVGYITVPKRDLGDNGKTVLDIKDIKQALDAGIKQEISGESKVIEGKFPEIAKTKKEFNLLEKVENISNGVERTLNNLLGVSNDEGEEIEDMVLTEPAKLQKITEKGKVINIDFKKKR